MPRGATTVEFYFSTVTGLAMPLEQDPPTGQDFQNFPTFQNFQNKYFLCSPSRWLYLNL